MIIGVLCLISGCSRKPQSSSVSFGEKSHLPVDLRDMQGNWHAGENEAMCEVQIDEFTIRLSFTGQTADDSYKRNASIKQVDQLNRTIEIHGDKNPWYYVIGRNDQGTTLSLRFFDTEKSQWVNSNMHPQSTAERVASR